MGKRGKPHNRERCLLLYGLHAYADLTFEEIGQAFGISKQAVHQQWERGRYVIGAIDKSDRIALMERCLKLSHSKKPTIIEFSDPRNKGKYNRQMEWDPLRIATTGSSGKWR